jgi:hypothetical protein
MVPQSNVQLVPVETQAAGWLPGPVATSTQEVSEQHFDVQQCTQGIIDDHNSAYDVLGRDNVLQADDPTFQLVFALSHQVRLSVHIDSVIGMVEGLYHVLFQLLPVLLQTSF